MRFKATIRRTGTIVTEAIGADGRTICSEVYVLGGADAKEERQPSADRRPETPGRRQGRTPSK